MADIVDEELETDIDEDVTGAAGDERENEDRGDDFNPEDDAADEVVIEDGPEETEEEKAARETAEAAEAEEAAAAAAVVDPASVPFSRLNEVSRTKTAATQIADAIVEGEIDPQIIKDLGGANVVAKAMASREITLEDLKTGAARAVAPNNPANPQTWDLDGKYVEYQEMIELGQIKESAALFREINKEERRRERTEEQAQQQVVAVKSTVDQLLAAHPTLKDVNHPDHEAVMAWTNYFQRDKGLNRIEALQKASQKVFIDVKPIPGTKLPPKKEEETPQQRLIRERKAAALKKNARAQSSQPPNMEMGSSPADTLDGKDLSKLTDEEYSTVSARDKAIARGDFIKPEK